MFTVTGSKWNLQQEIFASDGVAYDGFGYSLALSGYTLVVGAVSHAVGGNIDQGAAYVYTVAGSTWSQQQELIAGDGAREDLFGVSVAMSGNLLVVGGDQHKVGSNDAQGTAYVYTRATLAGSPWSPQQEIAAADGTVDSLYSFTMGLSGDTLIAGAVRQTVGSNATQGTAYIQNISTASAQVYVSVPPYGAIAVPQTFTTTPNVPTSLNVLQADTIASDEPVTLGRVGAVSPSGPTLTQNADGSFTFTSNTTGTYTFTHDVTGAGGTGQQVLLLPPAALSNGDTLAISSNTAVVGIPGRMG